MSGKDVMLWVPATPRLLFWAMARTLVSGHPAMGVAESGLVQVRTQ